MIISCNYNGYKAMDDFNDTDHDWFFDVDEQAKISALGAPESPGLGRLDQCGAADFSALNVPVDDGFFGNSNNHLQQQSQQPAYQEPFSSQQQQQQHNLQSDESNLQKPSQSGYNTAATSSAAFNQPFDQACSSTSSVATVNNVPTYTTSSTNVTSSHVDFANCEPSTSASNFSANNVPNGYQSNYQTSSSSNDFGHSSRGELLQQQHQQQWVDQQQMPVMHNVSQEEAASNQYFSSQLSGTVSDIQQRVCLMEPSQTIVQSQQSQSQSEYCVSMEQQFSAPSSNVGYQVIQQGMGMQQATTYASHNQPPTGHSQGVQQNFVIEGGAVNDYESMQVFQSPNDEVISVQGESSGNYVVMQAHHQQQQQSYNAANLVQTIMPSPQQATNTNTSMISNSAVAAGQHQQQQHSIILPQQQPLSMSHVSQLSLMSESISSTSSFLQNQQSHQNATVPVVAQQSNTLTTLNKRTRPSGRRQSNKSTLGSMSTAVSNSAGDSDSSSFTLGAVMQKIFASTGDMNAAVRFTPELAEEFSKIVAQHNELRAQDKTGMNLSEQIQAVEDRIVRLLSTAEPTTQTPSKTAVSEPASSSSPLNTNQQKSVDVSTNSIANGRANLTTKGKARKRNPPLTTIISKQQAPEQDANLSSMTPTVLQQQQPLHSVMPTPTTIQPIMMQHQMIQPSTSMAPIHQMPTVVVQENGGFSTSGIIPTNAIVSGPPVQRMPVVAAGNNELTSTVSPPPVKAPLPKKQIVRSRPKTQQQSCASLPPQQLSQQPQRILSSGIPQLMQPPPVVPLSSVTVVEMHPQLIGHITPQQLAQILPAATMNSNGGSTTIIVEYNGQQLPVVANTMHGSADTLNAILQNQSSSTTFSIIQQHQQPTMIVSNNPAILPPPSTQNGGVVQQSVVPSVYGQQTPSSSFVTTQDALSVTSSQPTATSSKARRRTNQSKGAPTVVSTPSTALPPSTSHLPPSSTTMSASSSFDLDDTIERVCQQASKKAGVISRNSNSSSTSLSFSMSTTGRSQMRRKPVSRTKATPSSVVKPASAALTVPAAPVVLKKPLVLPLPAELGKKISEKRNVRRERLAEKFDALRTDLVNTDYSSAFSSKQDCIQRLLPFSFLYEPDLHPEVLAAFDHEMLRHQVGVEEHMRNYNEKLRHIMYKESMSDYDPELNMLLSLDAEYEKQELTNEIELVRNENSVIIGHPLESFEEKMKNSGQQPLMDFDFHLFDTSTYLNISPYNSPVPTPPRMDLSEADGLLTEDEEPDDIAEEEWIEYSTDGSYSDCETLVEDCAENDDVYGSSSVNCAIENIDFKNKYDRPTTALSTFSHQSSEVATKSIDMTSSVGEISEDASDVPSSTPVAPLPQQTIVAEQQQTRVDRVVDGQNNLNLNLSHDDFYLPPKLRISRQRKLLSARDRSACLTVNVGQNANISPVELHVEECSADISLKNHFFASNVSTLTRFPEKQFAKSFAVIKPTVANPFKLKIKLGGLDIGVESIKNEEESVDHYKDKEERRRKKEEKRRKKEEKKSQKTMKRLEMEKQECVATIPPSELVELLNTEEKVALDDGPIEGRDEELIKSTSELQNCRRIPCWKSTETEDDDLKCQPQPLSLAAEGSVASLENLKKTGSSCLKLRISKMLLSEKEGEKSLLHKVERNVEEGANLKMPEYSEVAVSNGSLNGKSYRHSDTTPTPISLKIRLDARVEEKKKRGERKRSNKHQKSGDDSGKSSRKRGHNPDQVHEVKLPKLKIKLANMNSEGHSILSSSAYSTDTSQLFHNDEPPRHNNVTTLTSSVFSPVDHNHSSTANAPLFSPNRHGDNYLTSANSHDHPSCKNESMNASGVSLTVDDVDRLLRVNGDIDYGDGYDGSLYDAMVKDDRRPFTTNVDANNAYISGERSVNAIPQRMVQFSPCSDDDNEGLRSKTDEVLTKLKKNRCM